MEILRGYETSMLKQILQYWDQAGERPYEVLQEKGLYDDFLKYLESSSLIITDAVYRGTSRRGYLKKGDLFTYPYPTSWSYSYQAAYNFVEEEDNPVILSFYTPYPFKGLVNNYNTYSEQEIILAPMTLQVIDVIKKGKVTLIKVTPI